MTLSGCLAGGPTDTPVDEPSNNVAVNRRPIISGTPGTSTKISEIYDFQPVASDPENDPLVFSISNRPRWAAFDTASGELTGTTSLGDIGVYANIEISVSDGVSSTSLPAFSITVNQNGSLSTTLFWTAPTENEDASPLTDLAGYMVYYGRSSGSYDNQIRIDNPGVTTYVVEDLSADTYYFAATAFNASGVESRFSGEAVKTLN